MQNMGGYLNDYSQVAKLQHARKMHLYRKKYGDEALNTAYKLVGNYNPLSCKTYNF
jgi:hypothetical protein